MHGLFASRFFASAVAVALLALGIAPTAALGATAVDQAQTSTDGSIAVGCATPTPGVGLAQTFTAGTTGVLDTISLFLGANLSFNKTTETAEIHAVDASGIPTSTVLGRTRTVTLPQTRAWVDLALVRPIPVHEGSQYAIVLPSCPTAEWGLGTGNPYPAGAAWASNQDAWFPLSVSTHSDVDLAFQTTLLGQHGN